LIGAMTARWLLFGGGFGNSIFFNDEHHELLNELGEEFGNWVSFGAHAVQNPVFWLVAAGVFSAWALYIKWTHLPDLIATKLKPIVFVLENKYFFDWINEKLIAPLARLFGTAFWKIGDQGIIDGIAVDGSAKTIGFFAGVVRRVQSGFLYSYAFWMVIGLAVMLGWFLTRGLN